jgi:hypothetical protein
MMTFRQYEAKEIKRITAEHGCSVRDARECVRVLDWWKYIQEKCENGEKVSLDVCKSIVSNDCSLKWIAKTWPDSVPLYVRLDSGNLIK